MWVTLSFSISLKDRLCIIWYVTLGHSENAVEDFSSNMQQPYVFYLSRSQVYNFHFRMMSFAKLLLIRFSPSGFINNAQITRCPGPRCLHHLIWLKDGLQRNKVGQEESTAGIHSSPAVFQLHPRTQRSPFTFETYRNYVGPLATIKHTNDFTTLLRLILSLCLSRQSLLQGGGLLRCLSLAWGCENRQNTNSVGLLGSSGQHLKSEGLLTAALVMSPPNRRAVGITIYFQL